MVTRLALALALLAVPVAATREPSAETRPAPAQDFEARVDLVTVDVAVLDRSRRPVRGLTADDFTITENGVPRPVETFVEVDVAGPPSSRPVWSDRLGADVIENTREASRAIVIVLNDAGTGFSRGEPASVRTIARAVIDHLGPQDVAAVVYTHAGRSQNFTTNRVELMAAVDAFVPRVSAASGPPLGCVLRSCVTETLANVADVLQAAPPGRKLLVYIGSVFDLSRLLPDDDELLRATPDTMTSHLRTIQALQAANVSVYVFDPRGLAPTFASAEHRAPDLAARANALALDHAGLRALTEATGGLAFLGENAPENAVPTMFDENRSYYLLGIQPSPPADGRYRRLRVRVNRPDATVRTRDGYFRPGPLPAAGMTAKGDALGKVLGAGWARRDVPIEMSLLVLADRTTRGGAAVWMTARVDASGDPLTPVRFRAAMFDRNWRERGLVEGQSGAASADGRSPGPRDVQARFDVGPGRYELRLAAERGARLGSVIANVDVPDFSRRELTMSRIVFAHRDAGRPAPASDGLPLTPTLDRVFNGGDPVTAWVRIHQGTKRRPADAAATIRMLDSDGQVIAESGVSWRPSNSNRGASRISCTKSPPVASPPARTGFPCA